MGKSDLETLFALHIKAIGLPEPVREFRFDPVRMWRIDFAWPALMLAVEIEGGIWNGGRHTRGAGFVADMEKYNALTMAGWKLLRYDSISVKNGKAAAQVEVAVRLLEKFGGKNEND